MLRSRVNRKVRLHEDYEESKPRGGGVDYRAVLRDWHLVYAEALEASRHEHSSASGHPHSNLRSE